MFDAMQDGFNRYADFSGRSTRSQYWYFYLGSFLLIVVASFVGSEIIGNLVVLLMFIPSMSTGVRRMHDVGKSGWFIWVPIYNFILLIRPSKAI